MFPSLSLALNMSDKGLSPYCVLRFLTGLLWDTAAMQEGRGGHPHPSTPTLTPSRL